MKLRSISTAQIAGALLFIGVLQWLMIVLAAETLFPGYSIRANDLSDLASTIPPNVSPMQPSAMLFNASTFAIGLLSLISSVLIHFSFGSRLFSILFGVSGLFAMGVAAFPGDAGTMHGLVALGWFTTAPLSAIVSSRMVKGPLACFSPAIGIFSLVVLFFAFYSGTASPFQLFGRGGEERMLVYPVLLWMTAFAGYLMASGRADGQDI
ncbi:MAG: DUF998 domain-containing protein [Methanothrix sp.]|nr:DUF998 domain-containing protein [Methanothrix sp.]